MRSTKDQTERELSAQARAFALDLEATYGSNYRDHFAGEYWTAELLFRTPKQWDIAIGVIERVQPYLKSLAKRLLSGKVFLLKETPITLEGIDLDPGDLVNAANIHLLERFSRYDPQYSILGWVKLYGLSEMHRYGLSHRGLVHIPLGLQDKVNREGRDEEGVFSLEKVITLLGGNRSRKDLAQGVAFEKARLIRLSMKGEYEEIFCPVRRTFPGSTNYDTFENLYVEDLLAEEAEDTVLESEREKSIRLALATLSPREEYVLRKRFGFDGKEDLTLDEIAQTMDLTRKRVRQIEAKALRKLRHHSRRKRLRPFVE